MRRARSAARLLAWGLALAGCAPRDAVPPWRERPGSAQARVYHYQDDQGLTVLTGALAAEQPVSRNVSVVARGVLDRVVVERDVEIHEHTGNQSTGHVHDDVDAVTSASVVVLGGTSLEKTRVEGTLGAKVEGTLFDAPLTIEPSFRASSEHDYQALSGRVRATVELNERNTTLSVFAGGGRDRSDPETPPPGEANRWPATQSRVNGGFSVSQLLSKRLVLSGGGAASYQFGRLSNPYRRALILTSLFPERLPSSRLRVTGFATLSAYAGWDTAVHLRAGGYADSWDVLAFIPELAVVKEFENGPLVALQYRHYLQTAAEFYELRYESLPEYRTGDARLGRIQESRPSAEVSLPLVGTPGDFGSLSVSASYHYSHLRYFDLGRTVRGHILALALEGAY